MDPERGGAKTSDEAAAPSRSDVYGELSDTGRETAGGGNRSTAEETSGGDSSPLLSSPSTVSRPCSFYRCRFKILFKITFIN